MSKSAALSAARTAAVDVSSTAKTISEFVRISPTASPSVKAAACKIVFAGDPPAATEASPSIINNLRHHCYHITGEFPYPYRDHHNFNSPRLKSKLELLNSLLNSRRTPVVFGFSYKNLSMRGSSPLKIKALKEFLFEL